MNMMQVISGSTVKLTCLFENFNGEPTDQDLVKFKLYNGKYEVIEEIILGDTNRVGVGDYFIHHLMPDQIGVYYTEFYGEKNGVISINRDKVEVVFSIKE